MQELKGLTGNHGQALGKISLIQNIEINSSCKSIDDPEREIKKLEHARDSYRIELNDLFEETKKNFGETEAEIFHAYLEMVNDDCFFYNPLNRVKNELINIEFALNEEKKAISALFSQMDDPYMKERGKDIENVCNELLMKMHNVDSHSRIQTFQEPFIVIAEDLTPADTVRLDKTYLKGIVTEKGGQTSHTVILAKTLGIPAIVGATDILSKSVDGEDILIDGSSGEIFISPNQEKIEQYENYVVKGKEKALFLNKYNTAPAITQDGHFTEVRVNVGDIDSINTMNMNICDGIGLFRTEFLYMAENDYPSEEKQFSVYKKLAEKADGKNIIIRTLDIGGDKRIDYMNIPEESNPFLGYRAIRICLDKKDIFKTQLRALLRASAFGNISIMFPMIVTLEELKDAKAMVKECMQELEHEQISYNDSIQLGIMIETPAAVLISDLLASEADFFSIGTNDLIQYITATDRMNEKLQYLYRGCNLSVLRAIKLVAENAHRAGIPIGICGEAASDERLIPFWISYQIDELSMVSSQTAQIKYLICNTTKTHADEVTETALNMTSIEDVEYYLNEELQHYTELF